MSFLRLSRILLPVSIVMALVSLVLLLVPGPQLSIEFTGGTLMELRLPEGSDKAAVLQALTTFNVLPDLAASSSVATTTAGTVLLRTPTLENEQHMALIAHLQSSIGDVQELQFTTIGPTVGASLRTRSIWALTIATIAIVLYLAIMFRRMPGNISGWTFGWVAVLALLHDTIITVGIFVILSRLTSFQMDTLFVTALLSLMGYSVNDTIVIFDRIRSNLQESGKREQLEPLVDRSLRETLTRTINTGTGALIMLLVLFFFASESIRWFVLALIVGTLVGTYSSFFVAAPLLVFWQQRRMQR